MLSFSMGELFSGPGGMALGAHQAASRIDGVNLTHGWSNDIDESTCKTYLQNIPTARAENIYHGDVSALDIHSLPQIQGLAFGFPCNDFSLVGEQRGTDGKFGPLYSYGVGVLTRFRELEDRPLWFVAENVGGLQSANEGRALEQIKRELTEAGYRLILHKYRFEDYGVPQRRHRIIIVGIRKDLDVDFRVPAPTSQAKPITVVEALSDIASDAANNELTRQSAHVVERLNNIKPGKNAFNSNLPEHLQLNVKGARMSQIYRRLDPSQPSYTITGSGGGGTHVYHWEEPRALTNRERARLQTFPDDFIFVGAKESVRKQIGMAVPVVGATAIFEALFKSFLHIPYDSVPANMRSDLADPIRNATSA